MTKEPRKEPQNSPPETQTPPVSTGRLPFEQLAAQHDVTGWRLPALAASANWLPGQEVTAEQFAAAVNALDGEVIL
jgi:hypothetical protein